MVDRSLQTEHRVDRGAERPTLRRSVPPAGPHTARIAQTDGTEGEVETASAGRREVNWGHSSLEGERDGILNPRTPARTIDE